MEVTKMQLILNVYDPETKLVAKQYRAETVDIMFGTVEDIIDIVDVDKLDDNMELAKILIISMKKLKPLLKEVFTGVTDEELKNTSIKELIPLFKDIISFMMSELNGLGNGSKN
jgi:hypothetical protein